MERGNLSWVQYPPRGLPYAPTFYEEGKYATALRQSIFIERVQAIVRRVFSCNNGTGWKVKTKVRIVLVGEMVGDEPGSIHLRFVARKDVLS